MDGRRWDLIEVALTISLITLVAIACVTVVGDHVGTILDALATVF